MWSHSIQIYLNYIVSSLYAMAKAKASLFVEQSGNIPLPAPAGLAARYQQASPTGMPVFGDLFCSGGKQST